MLNCFRGCPHQFYLNYIRRIQRPGLSVHLLAGSAYAAGLETARNTYLLTKDPAHAIEQGFLTLLRTYGDYEPGDKHRNKTWNRTATAYLTYFDKWPLDSDYIQIAEFTHRPSVEFTFALDLPVRHPDTNMPLLYGGRVDWIGNFNGSLFCVDEKTTSYFTHNWASKWTLRAQFMGYVYAAHQHGIPITGSIVRGVAMKLTDIEHAEVILTIPNWRLERWYEQTLRDLERMIQCYETGVWDWNFGDTCNAWAGCSYEELCRVEDEERWLSATEWEENTWTPLREKGVE